MKAPRSRSLRSSVLVVAAALSLQVVAVPVVAAPRGVGVTVVAAVSSGTRRETSLWLVLDGPLLPRGRGGRAAPAPPAGSPLAEEEAAGGSSSPPSSAPAPSVEPPASAPAAPPLAVPLLAPALVRDRKSVV